MIITEEKLAYRLNNFDLLRLLAAIFVFISHTFDIREIRGQEPLYQLTGRYHFSTLGLVIFFSMSGFLVCRSLLTAPSIKQYLLNRFLRIWPAYAVCTLLTVCCIGAFLTTLPVVDFFIHPQTWVFIFKNLSLLTIALLLPGVLDGHPVNSSIWTIPIEVRLYLGLLVLYFISKMRLKQVIFFSFLLFLILKIVVPIVHPKNIFSIPFYTLISLGTYFLAGAFVYINKEKIPFKLSIWLILFAGWLCLRIWFPAFLFLAEEPFFVYTLLWIALCWPKIPFIKADFSYAFYLYAFPVQQTLQYLYGNRLSLPVFILVTFLLTAAISIASWFLIEKKALKYKHAFLKPATLPGSNFIQQPENNAGSNK